MGTSAGSSGTVTPSVEVLIRAVSPQRGESKVLGALSLDSEAPTLPFSCGVPAFDLDLLGSSFESFF